MDKEEYYKRIEKINNRFKTDRVSADEGHRLVCLRNYLSTKYIEHLEQQCKKQKEAIDKAIEYIEKFIPIDEDTILMKERQRDHLLDILKEVSE